MIKKVDILGMQLDNYTVREAIMQVDVYLNNNELNVIESITAKMLLESEGDEVLKHVIDSLDLAVIGEKEIIQAAGLGSMQRIKETEECDFHYEFFKRVERNSKTVYLLGEKRERLDKMQTQLVKDYPNLSFVGCYATEECVGDLETVINDMNVKAPDVICSLLPNPVQEHFLWEHKDKMNANIWYGVGDLDIHKNHHGLAAQIKSVIDRGKLKNSISKYHVEKEDSK